MERFVPGIGWYDHLERKMDKRKFLKIKLKSLMAESKIIRKEEGRTRDPFLREEMHRHRVLDLRVETRATHLAYAMLRGVPYNRIENRQPADRLRSRQTPSIDGKRVAAMLRKYGDPHLSNATGQTVSTWISETLHEPRVPKT